MRFTLSLLAAALCAQQTQASDDVVYTFYQTPLSQQKAQAYCKSQGQNLASIKNADENVLVHNVVKHLQNNVWIGLNDRAVAGTYVQASGVRTTYTNWAPKNPTGATNQRCTMYRTTSKEFLSTGCDSKRDFVCEKRTQVATPGGVPAAPTAPEAPPAAPATCSGAAKGDFPGALSSEGAWAAYQRANQCRAEASAASKAARNTAVAQWFRSVTAAKTTLATYRAAKKTLSATSGALARAGRKSETATARAATARTKLAEAKAAATKAKDAERTGNEGANNAVRDAESAQESKKLNLARAVRQAHSKQATAQTASAAADTASSVATKAKKDAQSAFDVAQTAETTASSASKADQKASIASRAASIRAHKSFTEGNEKQQANGYFH